MDYSIVRLQVQREPLKPGRAPLRRYDPAAIVPVHSMTVGPRGVQGVATDGARILDVHHQDHPKSRDRRGKAGILFMGTGDYDALRRRYGDHVIDGIAGETVLLDVPAGLAGRRLPKTVTVLTAAGPVELRAVRPADPCIEFSRFCLRREVSPDVDDVLRQTLIDLDGGARGYRCIATTDCTISIGDGVSI
jgi:hypothetical protein